MAVQQLEMIAWLNRAFYAEKKVKALESLRNSDRERAQRITANYEGNDKGKSDTRLNGTEEALITLAESEEKYDNALKEYSLMRQEIEKAIENLHNPVIEAIFIYRYLEYLSMEQIAEAMNYDLRTIQRKHKYGLEKLSPNVMVCHP